MSTSFTRVAEGFIAGTSGIAKLIAEEDEADELFKEFVDAVATAAKPAVRQCWSDVARRCVVNFFDTVINGDDSDDVRALPLWLREAQTPGPQRSALFTPGLDDERLSDEILNFLEDIGVGENELGEYSRAEVSAEARRHGLSSPARTHVLALCKCLEPTGVGGGGLDADEIARMIKLEVDKSSAVSKADASVPDGIATARQRLARLNVNPTAKFKTCLDAHVAREDWPLAGTQFSARLAGEYLARVYAGGLRATDYYKQWIRMHCLESCKAAQEVLFHAAILDALLLVDEINVSNSYACELLARRCYGFELVFADCNSRDQWKSKAKYKLLDVYDASALDRAGPRVGAADVEARKALETEASFNKWLAKAPAAAE
jgi:hypothetical protein